MIELATFRPAAGVADEALRLADADVQQRFACFQPGFVRRTTAVSDDGEWAVLTLWGDVASADAAATAAATDPSVRTFAALADPETLVVRRYHELPG